MEDNLSTENCEVLIAEDDQLVNWVIKEWVEETGRTAYLAENAVQALQMLQSHSSIRIMVTDIHLPIIDGHELIQEALALQANLKIVIMTGLADEGESSRKYPVLRKPFSATELAEVLSQLCENKIPN